MIGCGGGGGGEVSTSVRVDLKDADWAAYSASDWKEINISALGSDKIFSFDPGSDGKYGVAIHCEGDGVLRSAKIHHKREVKMYHWIDCRSKITDQEHSRDKPGGIYGDTYIEVPGAFHTGDSPDNGVGQTDGCQTAQRVGAEAVLQARISEQAGWLQVLYRTKAFPGPADKDSLDGHPGGDRIAGLRG